jgi:hypothetical protein
MATTARHPVGGDRVTVHPLQDADRDSPFLERLRAGTLTTAQLSDLPEPEALIDGMLYRESVAFLFGPAGVSKSFLALDLACHVEAGQWWNGRKVHRGPVVYVVAEGVGGIGRRIEAWTEHHGVNAGTHAGIHWVPFAVNLFDYSQAADFAAYCTELSPALVIFDTLARCTVGAEENSARDAGRVNDHVDRIKAATGACCLLVHHTGHEGGRMRGSSAYKGAADTELSLSGSPEHLSLEVSKQKDGAVPPPINLRQIAAGRSRVLVPGAAALDPDSLPESVQATLDALAAIQIPGGVSSSAWEAAVNTSPRTFYRHRAGLVQTGKAINVGTEKAPRYVVVEGLAS